MRPWKSIFWTFSCFVALSFVVVYSSCEKDSCLELQCKNEGVCTNGFCQCPTGYEGTECEFEVATAFLGRYYGNTKCDMAPPTIDSVSINLLESPNVISIYHFGSDQTVEGIVEGNKMTSFKSDYFTDVTLSLNEGKNLILYMESLKGEHISVCSFAGSKE